MENIQRLKHRIWIIFMLLFSSGLNLGLAHAIQLRSKDILLFSERFDDLDSVYQKFKESGNKTATIQNFSYDKSNFFVKITLDRTKDQVPYRTEIQAKDLPSSHFMHGLHAKLGFTYYYCIKIFIPEDWKFNENSEFIMQWHAYPDFKIGETWRNPPVSFVIGPDSLGRRHVYKLLVFSDKEKLTIHEGKESYDRSFVKELGDVTKDLGKWTRWTFKIKWAYDRTGFIEITKNDKIIYKETAKPNTFNDEFGPYWKIGIYKPIWKKSAIPEVDSAQITERVIYFDDVQIWGESID